MGRFYVAVQVRERQGEGVVGIGQVEGTSWQHYLETIYDTETFPGGGCALFS
jgi:hypothetical protein